MLALLFQELGPSSYSIDSILVYAYGNQKSEHSTGTTLDPSKKYSIPCDEKRYNISMLIIQ